MFLSCLPTHFLILFIFPIFLIPPFAHTLTFLSFIHVCLKHLHCLLSLFNLFLIPLHSSLLLTAFYKTEHFHIFFLLFQLFFPNFWSLQIPTYPPPNKHTDKHRMWYIHCVLSEVWPCINLILHALRGRNHVCPSQWHIFKCTIGHGVFTHCLTVE